MADTQETSDDIIAEMIRVDVCADGEPCLRDYARRFDAALKREKAEWVNANAGLAKIVDIEKIGNFAALHEALAESRRFVWASAHRTDRDLLVTDDGKRGPYVLTPKETLIKIDAALSAPTRNCDRFNTGDPVKDAEDAYVAWQRYCEDPTIPPSCKVESAFKNWLFAHASAKEGGGDAD